MQFRCKSNDDKKKSDVNKNKKKLNKKGFKIK